MGAYMIESGYYCRKFVGETSDKPSAPEKDGDVFIDLETAKNYIGFGGSWVETSVTITI